MSFIKITDHAKQRSARRYGMMPDCLRELAEKAITEGYSYGDAPNGEIAGYLKRKARGGRKIYAYGGYLFLFSEDLVLITTYRLPMKYLMTLPRKKTYIGTS